MEAKVGTRYLIDHTYARDGFPDILDEDSVEWKGNRIEIIKEDTGKDAPQTYWDRLEGVAGGDIVTVQIMLNGKAIGDPTEMWLSNRERGSRYFSWLDVLSVYDDNEGSQSAAIVQRLTDDDTHMDDRQWRIIHIAEDGSWREEHMSYRDREAHHLGVKLVRVSGTSLMAMGYYSDTLHYYPTLFFPLLYPWITTALGVMMLLVAIFMVIRDVRARENVQRAP
jgi:hypothetical protein